MNQLLSTQQSASVIGTQARLETILMFVYGYTAGETPPWLGDLKARGLKLQRSMARISKSLRDLSNEAGALEDRETWLLKVPQDVVSASKEIGLQLGAVAERGRKHLSKRNLNRDFLLLLLVHYVKLSTGQPYYEEISKLLYTSALILKTELYLSGEAIRALYVGFIERNPKMLDACLVGRLP